MASKEQYYNQGMELFAQGKIDEAIAAYRKALEEDPRYADALHALAMVYAQQERLDEAIETGKRLVEVSPDDELAYTSLSIFYQRKGMIAEAEQAGAKARTLGWKRELAEQKAEKEKR
ncbi:MAG TPA: tetratricopeptide repeat protein [Candidatus Acidoferrales bacterium]|nr:tetratricopeptide repeat protein [Candidatus Acidoferrales bacterium]